MKQLFYLRITFFLLYLTIVSTPVFPQWEKNYGWIFDEETFSMQITTEKDYAMAGWWEEVDHGHHYFYLIKVSSSGDSLWAKTYKRGRACEVSNTNDGGYIAGGYFTVDSRRKNYYLVKTDENGDTLWTHTYGIDEGSMYCSIIPTEVDNYMVMWDAAPDSGIYIMKIDSVGDTIWAKSVGGLPAFGYCMEKSYDGGFIITGLFDVGYPYGREAYIAKIDSFGVLIWDTCYGGLGVQIGRFITQTADGNYIMVGMTSVYSYTLFDVFLLKIDEDGDTLWTRIIGSDYESDNGNCVKQTNDGGYIFTGWTYSYGPGTPDSSNVYLVKTDSEGYVEWERTYGGTGEDKGYSVSQTEDGGYIIAGVYDQGPHTDVYLIKTDSLGETEWIREVPTKPQEFSMNVYPNPFNATVTIRIQSRLLSGQESRGQVEIFDINGRVVKELERSSVGAFERPGSPDPRITQSPDHRFTGSAVYSWTPDNKVTSGVYLVRAEAGTEVITKKIIYLK